MRADPFGAVEHQCHNKVRHLTRDFAKQSLKAMKAHGLGKRLTIYRCPHCDFFHVGRKPKVFA